MYSLFFWVTQAFFSGRELVRYFSSNMGLNSSGGVSPVLQSAAQRKPRAVYGEAPLADVQRRKSKLFMKPRLTKDSQVFLGASRRPTFHSQSNLLQSGAISSVADNTESFSVGSRVKTSFTETFNWLLLFIIVIIPCFYYPLIFNWAASIRVICSTFWNMKMRQRYDLYLNSRQMWADTGSTL